MIFSAQRQQWVAVALATVLVLSGCEGSTGSSSSSSSPGSTSTQTETQRTAQNTGSSSSSSSSSSPGSTSTQTETQRTAQNTGSSSASSSGSGGTTTSTQTQRTSQDSGSSSASSSGSGSTTTSTQTQRTSQDTAQSWQNTQRQTSQRNAAPAVRQEAMPGSRFNRFFPKSGNGYQVVAAQEKKGFSEYKLKRGGSDMAVLSISDTISLPAARKKYEKSTQKIGGFPAVNQGTNITGVLVADRFQVKAQSRDRSFTDSDRQAWLQKFDLQGLSRLK